MTEAEKYLAEKRRLDRIDDDTVLPSLNTVNNPSTNYDYASDRKKSSTSQGTKWLSFVNYGILPFNAVMQMIGLGGLFASWDDIGYFFNPVVMLTLSLLDLAMIVALFIGLKNRTVWGWWLMIVFLFVKAPLGALSRYGPGTGFDPTSFVLFLVIGFVLVCLPQLYYFYNRRGLFGVRLKFDC